MNALEGLAIAVILSVLQDTVKNPAHKIALQGQLTSIATQILAEYGYTVTPPATLPEA